MHLLWQKIEGTITRNRITNSGKEESIIDFLIISNDLVNYFVSLYIDEKMKNVLTSFSQNKVKERDHNTMIAKFKFTPKELSKPKRT